MVSRIGPLRSPDPEDRWFSRFSLLAEIGLVGMFGCVGVMYVRSIARDEAHEAENRCMSALEYHEERKHE